MTISRALVNVVIDQQIGQQISVCLRLTDNVEQLAYVKQVDTISDVLQSRCGSFCSTDDVMLYKAKENIRKAAETHDAVEKQRCLGEALRYVYSFLTYHHVANSISSGCSRKALESSSLRS